MLRITDGKKESCSESEIVKVNPHFIVKRKNKKRKVINRIILKIYF